MSTQMEKRSDGSARPRPIVPRGRQSKKTLGDSSAALLTTSVVNRGCPAGANKLDVKLCPAAPSHLDIVTTFNCFQADELRLPRRSYEEVRQAIRKVLNDVTLGQYFLAFRGSTPIAMGRLSFEFDDRQSGVTATIGRLYVVPKWRRSGVAKHIVCELADRAARIPEVHEVQAFLQIANGPSRALFQSLGFRTRYYCSWRDVNRDRHESL